VNFRPFVFYMMQELPSWTSQAPHWQFWSESKSYSTCMVFGPPYNLKLVCQSPILLCGQGEPMARG